MSQIVACSKCDKRYKVADDNSVETMKCSRCGTTVRLRSSRSIPKPIQVPEPESPAVEQRKRSGELTCPSCQATFVPRLPRPGSPLRCPECKEVHPTSPYDETNAQRRARTAQARRGTLCTGCQRILPPGSTYCTTCNLSTDDAFVARDPNVPILTQPSAFWGPVRFVTRLIFKSLFAVYLLCTFRWFRLARLYEEDSIFEAYFYDMRR